MPNEVEQDTEILRNKINLETAKIPWLELQRFFAAGQAIFVQSELDLVDVAYQFSQDNAQQIQHWLSQQKIVKVSDTQAKHWLASETIVWAVVVRPWVLIQDKDNAK